MITFSIAFRGYEEDLDDFALVLHEALDLSAHDASELAYDIFDVDQQVVMQVSDEAFGRLCAGLSDFSNYIGDYEAVEVEVHYQEPDPVIYSIYMVPAGGPASSYTFGR